MNVKDWAPVQKSKMAERERKEIVFSDIKNKQRRSTLYQKEKLRKAKEKRERKRKRKREESQEEGEVSCEDFLRRTCKQTARVFRFQSFIQARAYIINYSYDFLILQKKK